MHCAALTLCCVVSCMHTRQAGLDKLMVQELDGTQNEWGW